ncbi:hypothetical protein LJK88_49640 [Paenibacillus sp. P26]|nr:hypothetical protein LJK88_49640 [Paenibacillus sp. P26]
MQEIREIIERMTAEALLIQATLSQVRKKEPDGCSKVTVKPVELKGSGCTSSAPTAGRRCFTRT